MGDFINMEEDWGLQAIVRGSADYCDHDLNATSSVSNSLNYNIQNYLDDDFCFTLPPHLSEANYYSNDHKALVNELDDLYKPFYPTFNSFSPQTSIVTSSNSSELVKSEEEVEDFEEQAVIPRQKSTKAASPKNSSHATKYKRKNQNKRVVVTADGICSDLWAWRKYGQKPIKGSPYPRSYYRCSSLKGCVARKQVEQSCAEPGKFIITYSGEHSHSQPTRRSSLAGTNRHKFTAPKTASSTEACASHVAIAKDSSCSPPTSDISEEAVMPQQQQYIKHEHMGEEMHGDHNEFVASDIIFNDDFFAGLEDLDALISNSNLHCSLRVDVENSYVV